MSKSTSSAFGCCLWGMKLCGERKKTQTERSDIRYKMVELSEDQVYEQHLFTVLSFSRVKRLSTANRGVRTAPCVHWAVTMPVMELYRSLPDLHRGHSWHRHCPEGYHKGGISLLVFQLKNLIRHKQKYELCKFCIFAHFPILYNIKTWFSPRMPYHGSRNSFWTLSYVKLTTPTQTDSPASVSHPPPTSIAVKSTRSEKILHISPQATLPTSDT